jgi:O-antigen ligase
VGVPHREEGVTRRNQTLAAGGGSPAVRPWTGTAMETDHTRRWRLSEGRLAEIALLIFGALILSGPPRLRTRDLDAALEQPLSLDPAALLQVVAWMGAGGIVAYLIYRDHLRRGGLLRALSRDRLIAWYLAFALLGVASAAWSASPPYTLFSASKLLIGVLAVILIVSYGRYATIDRAIRLLFIVYAVKFSVLIMLFLIRPQLVYQAEYQGRLLTTPRLNGGVVLEDFGTSPLFTGLALLTVAIFGSSRARRRLALLGYVVTWIFLVLSQTRTAIIPGVIFLVIMASLRKSSRAVAVLIAAAALGLCLTVLVRQSEAVLRVATRAGEGVSTISGRTDAFDYLIEQWRASPIVGFGYGAGTRILLIDFVKATGLGIGAGHDILSTTLVDLGLLGAAILAIVFILTWRQVILLWARAGRRTGHRVTVAQLTCFAVWATINSSVGQGIFSVAPPFLVLLATSWMLLRSLPARPRPAVPVVAERSPADAGGGPSPDGNPLSFVWSAQHRRPT